MSGAHGEVLVKIIERRGALSPDFSADWHWLPAAANTAAWAGHHFHIIILAFFSLDVFNQFSGIAQAADNGYPQIFAANIYYCFFYPLLAADLFEFNSALANRGIFIFEKEDESVFFGVTKL